jgi:thymidine kinase
MDFAGRPFGSMPDLLAIAERVSKLRAICTKCGDEACRSQRLTDKKDVVALGAGDTYEARCRRCFILS